PKGYNDVDQGPPFPTPKFRPAREPGVHLNDEILTMAGVRKFLHPSDFFKLYFTAFQFAINKFADDVEPFGLVLKLIKYFKILEKSPTNYVKGLTYSTIYEIVGHSVALKCPELDQDYVVSTAIWSKDTELVAIKAANDKWILPINSKAKIEENNAQSIQLMIENLEMKDTAIYKCELFYADQTGSNNLTSTTKLIVQ
ncbi:piggyBac transposable element-derived protein 3, partial [Biomphalaria pfeifferi]